MKRFIYPALISTLLLVSCNKVSIKHNPEIRSIIQSDSIEVESIKSELQDLKYEIAVKDSQIVELNNKYEKCIGNIKKSEENTQTKINIFLSLVFSIILFFIVKILVKIKNKSK